MMAPTGASTVGWREEKVDDLLERIDASWDSGELDAEAIETAIAMLDRGEVRVAEQDEDGTWTVNESLKRAILLFFRVGSMTVTEVGPFE